MNKVSRGESQVTMFTSIASLGGIFESIEQSLQIEKRSLETLEKSELYARAEKVCERIIENGLVVMPEDKEVLDYTQSPVLNQIYTRLDLLARKNKTAIKEEDILHLWHQFPTILQDRYVNIEITVWDDLDAPCFVATPMEIAGFGDNLEKIIAEAVVQYGGERLFHDYHSYCGYQHVTDGYAVLDSGRVERVEMFREVITSTWFVTVVETLMCCREFVPAIWDLVTSEKWWNARPRREEWVRRILKRSIMLNEFVSWTVSNSDCVTAVLDRYRDGFRFGDYLSLQCTREAVRGLIPRVKDFPCWVELRLESLIQDRDVITLGLIAREWSGTVNLESSETVTELHLLFPEEIVEKFRAMDTGNKYNN